MGGETPRRVSSDPGAAAPPRASLDECAPEVESFPADASVEVGDVLVFHTPTPLRSMWRPSLWLPFLIHLATRSRWNHAALAIGDSDAGQPLMVEATARGVRVNPVAARTDERRAIRLRYCGNDRTEVLAFAAGRVGLRYGFFNAFWCGLRHVFPGTIQIKFGNQVICSELVAESLERAGYDWRKDTALVSPGDVAEQLGLPRR